MKILDNYKGLPRSIYILFIIQIINKFGNFVVPFLTLLLTEKLGLSFGDTGIIVMIASLITIPASFLGGRFADKFGRKNTYLFGQSLAALAILICGFIHNPTIIIALLISSSFFNGFVWPTMSAIVADVLTPEKRQAGSSLIYMGINIGFALGPIVAGFLFNNFLPLLYIGDAITSFIAVFIFYVFIKETKLEHGKIKPNTIHEKEEYGCLIKVLLKRVQILTFFTINIIFSLIYTQHEFSLPMMLHKEFGSKASAIFGFLMSINAISVVCLSFFIIAITKKFNPLTNIIFAGIFYAIGFGMIGIIDSFALYIVSTILWTIGEILISTNFGVYVANNSPQNFRARFNAVGSLSYAIGGALGTSVMGKYIDYAGIKAVWPIIFILSCIATILIALLQLEVGKPFHEVEEIDI